MNSIDRFSDLKECLLYFIDSGYFSISEGDLLKHKLNNLERSLAKETDRNNKKK